MGDSVSDDAVLPRRGDTKVLENRGKCWSKEPQKRKRIRNSSKPKGEDVSVSALMKTWDVIKRLHPLRLHFAMTWLLRNDRVLQTFITDALGSNLPEFHIPIDKFSRGLLFNGYQNLRSAFERTGSCVFPKDEWKLIGSIFTTEEALGNLPKPVRECIRHLRDADLETYLAGQEEKFQKNTNFSFTTLQQDKVVPDMLSKCKGCFLGSWDHSIIDTVRPEARQFLHRVPTEFVLLTKSRNYTFVYDKSRGDSYLVAMILRHGMLLPKAANVLRTLLSRLFAGHPQLTRGAKKEAFKSHMSGFGPFFHRYTKGENKVSFYTHVIKLKKSIVECTTMEDFDRLVDKYCHLDAVNIILALYLQWCPQLLRSFFSYSRPYLDDGDHEASYLESFLDLRFPSAYQLYITEDYCSEMHADKDATDFTLCYCSHPDSERDMPVDFVVAEYGVRLPVGDTDLFAFRSSVVHGTSYRRPSTNPVYMGCVAVNRPLHNLIQRRRRAQAT